MWHNERRFRRAKVVQHTDIPNRYRISASIDPMHYGQNEIDMTPARIQTTDLNGWRCTNNGWHFAYQGFAEAGNQHPVGSLCFGGKEGQHELIMRPHRMGYFHWGPRTFEEIGGPPTFGPPILDTKRKTIGINDDDPAIWTLNHALETTVPNIWTTPNGGTVDWVIKSVGGQLKQDFIVDQTARVFLRNTARPRTPAAQTWFGIQFKLDMKGIPRMRLKGNPRNMRGDDFEVLADLALENTGGEKFAYFGLGKIFVPNRGGRVPIRKRVYFDGTDWFFFIGCNVRSMNNNLLDGDLIIDPPITEEDITQNADDAYQGNSTMALSGYANRDYLGQYNAGAYVDHSGWRFQTVPITQYSTINSATLEPTQNGGSNQAGVTATLYGNDVDSAAAFTTASNNITSRTRTTASTNLTSADWPGAGVRGSWDVASIVEEIVGRAGWSEGSLAFVGINTTPLSGTNEIGFDDYAGGVGTAADFNADFTAPGAGGGPINFMTLLGVG